jgi:hypothetical protein
MEWRNVKKESEKREEEKAINRSETPVGEPRTSSVSEKRV